MTNLFPPIIDSYMPSFAIEKNECQILFQISDYNSIEEITGAEISVRFQTSDATALKDNKTVVQVPENQLNLEKGTLTLSGDLLQNGFETNKIYKVQIRFFKQVENKETEKSEWSTVCLIKGIKEPSLDVPLFDEIADIGDMVVNTDIIEVNAQVEGLEEEIYYYRMCIKKGKDIHEDSGEIYTTDANDTNLRYTFKKRLEINQNYKLIISLCTTSYYVFEKEYDFVHNVIDEQLDIEILLQENNEHGYLEAAVPMDNLSPGTYVILRASSLDDFTTWKDIHKFQRGIDNIQKTTLYKAIQEIDENGLIAFQTNSVMSEPHLNEKPVDAQWYHYKDYTVQSGVMYKYKIQNYGKGGIRSIDSRESAAALCYFDDIFLNDKNFQLKIKYDSNVSGLKRNILESKTDTIGGKYPYIKRNGQMKYESFSISGIIAIHGDDNEFYDSSWKENVEWKNTYFNKYGITSANDFIGEKKYRDIVADFLYDGKVKLFRSTQEGNYLVRLMDISFTPNQQLGRMIYSFQATAYQIADLTIDNYIKFNIINKIEYKEEEDILSKEYVIVRKQVSNIDDLYQKNIYNIDGHSIETELEKIEKIKITSLNDYTEICFSDRDSAKLRHPGHSITLYSEDLENIVKIVDINDKESNVLVDYIGEMKLKYNQDYFKTKYISFNTGQLNCIKGEEVLSKIVNSYNDGIKDNFYQEIEKINAIKFYNYNDKNIEIIFTYENNNTSIVTISPQSSYSLLSDILETKGIKSIVFKDDKNYETSNFKLYIDYYYALSKKYYYK